MSNHVNFNNLAKVVIFKQVTPASIKRLGFKLKLGKTLSDVIEAKKLGPTQPKGDMDIMIKSVEENLAKCVTEIKNKK